jgi:hypothetical protein
MTTWGRAAVLGSHEMNSAVGGVGGLTDCSSGSGCNLMKEGVQVGNVKIEGPPTRVLVSILEASVGRGFSAAMYDKLDKPHSLVPCDANKLLPCVSALKGESVLGLAAAATGTMTDISCLYVVLICRACMSCLYVVLICRATGTMTDMAVSLSLQVDTSVVKSRGGCYTTDAKTLKICLPGAVGMYRFVDGRWKTDSQPTKDSTQMALQYTGKLDTMSGANAGLPALSDSARSATVALLASSPCCDYKGSGAVCGEKVCLDKEEREQVYTESIVLGQGTLAKMPAIGLTDRPAFQSASDVAAASVFGNAAKEIKLEHGWMQICPSGEQCAVNIAESKWYAPRFGHVVKTVGASNVLIYGGVGCKVVLLICRAYMSVRAMYAYTAVSGARCVCVCVCLYEYIARTDLYSYTAVSGARATR